MWVIHVTLNNPPKIPIMLLKSETLICSAISTQDLRIRIVEREYNRDRLSSMVTELDNNRKIIE